MRIQCFLPLLFGLLLPFQVSFGADIVATGGDDLVVVNVAAQRVFVNGAATVFDRTETLRIRGGGGNDRVVINGAATSMETVRMEATRFRLLDQGGLIFGENFERIEFRGQVDDACVMIGTGGVDNLKLLPTVSQLTTPLATFTANAVERVNVQGQSGDDVVDVANPALTHVTVDVDTVRVPGAPGVYPTKHTILDFERVNTTGTVESFNFFNRIGGDLLVLRRALRWSSENLDLFHDGTYKTVNTDKIRSVEIRMPELDGCRFNGEFEGVRGDGDPIFVFSDIERRINMGRFTAIDIEILPGPSTQTSRAFLNDRRFSSDTIAASLETGVATASYGGSRVNLSVAGFDSTTISRREADSITHIEGSSGDDTLVHPGATFTGNGREIIYRGRGVVFDGKSGNDEYINLFFTLRTSVSNSAVEVNFAPNGLDVSRTFCQGFEERTLVGSSSDSLYLFMDDDIRISPDRVTVNGAGVTTTAIGFGTYSVMTSERLSRAGSYGNNVVYNNQNDPTLVQGVGGELFDLGTFRDPFDVTYTYETYTTDRATIRFATQLVDFFGFSDSVGNVGSIRVVNP